MYPTRELNELAVRKERLTERIEIRRQICIVSARHALRPIVWLDQARAKWQQWSPWVKMATVPASLLVGRIVKNRLGWVGSILRTAPGIISLFKTFAR